MMTVKLKNTGLTILTGDNVYFRENVEKDIPPNIVLAYDRRAAFSAPTSGSATDGHGEGGLLHRPRSGRLQGDEEGARILRLTAARIADVASAGSGRHAPRWLSLDGAGHRREQLTKIRSAASAVDDVSFEVGRRGDGAARPERLGQDHDPAHPDRLSAAERGNRARRRLRRRAAMARAARRRVGYVPEDAPALRQHAGPRVPRVHGPARGLDGAAAARRGRGGVRAAGARGRPARPSSASCRAATGSAWPSPRPCCTSRTCWCWTSRPMASIRARSSSSASCIRGLRGPVHGRRHLAYPGRDRAARRPGGDPARRAAARGARARRRAELLRAPGPQRHGGRGATPLLRPRAGAPAIVGGSRRRTA